MLVVVVQAAIPLQLHTALAKSGSGQVVVVCTWAGPRTVAFGEPEPPPGEAVDRVSPACLFSQLLAAAAVTANTTGASPVFVTVSTAQAVPETQVRYRNARSYGIRGPPAGRIVA
jgi:hypothetical protein